jgi:protocatechuate 3,4-dioxygenase beta subunit
MSNGRSRGLVFFVLIAVVAGLGGLGIWRLSKRGGGPGEEAASAEGAAPGARRLVKGTGTSWREEEASSDPSGVIEGVVLDADGAPVDGASVVLGRARGRGEETPFYTYWQPKGTATSAGGGRFRIDKLIPGEYSATAAKEGAGPGQRGQIEVKANQTARVEIKLARTGLVLSGRVLDVGGGPVGGARIAASARVFGGGGRAPTLFFTVSAGDGQYRLVLPRGPAGLRAEAEGYAPLSEYDILMVRSTTRDLRLVPGGRVAGRVFDRASKQPIADAEVSVTSALRMDFREPRDGKTDGNGHFEFNGLEPGNYEVMARKGIQIGNSDVVALAVAQSVTDVEVPVDRGYVVSGLIKSDAGKPLGGVRVSASRDSPPFGQAARTKSNPDGTYALEGMLPGNYRVSAWEEGYGSSGGTRARVVAADVGNIDLTLPVAMTVSGLVVNSQGKPVEGARVQARIESRRSGGSMFTTGDGSMSGPDGKFELKRITEGVNLQVTVQADQEGTASVGPMEIKAGEPTKVLTLVLKKGAAVSGTVRTDDGKPVPDVRVSVMSRSSMPMIMNSGQDVTGPDGRYRIENIPAGRVTIAASRTSRPDFDFSGTDRPHSKSFELGATEDRTGVDLVVGAPGLAIKGTVQSTDGKPVSGAVLTASLERDGRAFRGGSRDLRAYSQMDGQFSLEDVNKATYTVWASHPDHPEAELTGVTPGGAPVKLQFPPDTSVSGLVVSSQDKPIAHYTITVLPGPKADETPEQRRRRTMDVWDARSQRVQSPNGGFELRRLAAGTHELQVSAATGETGSQVVTLQAGERKAGLRIQLQAALRVSGRMLEHPSGKPIPGATVSVTGRGGARAETEVSPDGSFLLEGAPVAETLRISAQADFSRWVPEWKEVELKPGQTAVDVGTIRLIAGNMRERMGMDRTERGDMGGSIGLENGRAAIRGARPEGALAKAGLKKGDLVTSINGTSTAELGNGALNYLSAAKAGATVTLVVETPGAPARTVQVTLDAYKPPTPPPSPAPRSN